MSISNLTKIVKDLRHNDYNYGGCVHVLQSILNDIITENGATLKRRRIVLTAHGCSVSTCTICPLPDESVPNYIQVTNDDLKRQIDEGVENSEDCDVLTVYHNGNFFADREMPPEIREYLYQKISRLNFKTLVVESLPQFITTEKLQIAKLILKEKKIQVAIGLQSWNDVVREQAINSTCTKKGFLTALQLLRDVGYSAQVFLMFKPPFLTTEESINDLVNGVIELNKIGINDPILCPMRISKNTVVDVLFKEGNYVPPTLWQLIHSIELIHKKEPYTKCRVAISCLTGLDGINSIRTMSCPKCFSSVVKSLVTYNHSHDISLLESLDCECKNHETKNPIVLEKIEDRVLNFIENHTFHIKSRPVLAVVS